MLFVIEPWYRCTPFNPGGSYATVSDAPISAALLIMSTPMAQAQCTFQQPKKAGKYQVSLIPAFKECGGIGLCSSGFNTCLGDDDCNLGGPSDVCESQGPTSNTTTEGSVPACAPPEGAQPPGAPAATSWRWDSAGSSGSVQMKPAANKVGDIAGRDFLVQVTLSGIHDGNGALANDPTPSGGMRFKARVTLDDRVNGDMTVGDSDFALQLQLTDGKGKYKSSLNASLASIGQPTLPSCTLVQPYSVEVHDANGDLFAVPGLR